MCLVVESANYVQWDLILHDETNTQKIPTESETI